MLLERGNMCTICEEQAVFLTDQEHVGNAAASSSNAGKSKPSEWTCPGCDQIKTKACCEKLYNWRGGKRTKRNIPPESEISTSEKKTPTVARTCLQP